MRRTESRHRPKVVGGSDKGGILVRKGQDLKSEQCADRGSAWFTQVSWWEDREDGRKTHSLHIIYIKIIYIYIYDIYDI